MKRLSFITILGLIALFAHAQFPVSDPHCAYCDVNLKTASAHKNNCPYYSKPSNDDESSSSSTNLRDYTPLPEMSYTERTLIYEVGVNGVKPCSHCKSLKHLPWCEIINMQKGAKEYRAKAESARTETVRKQALRDYKRMVDNLKLFINLNYTKADLDAYNLRINQEETERKVQSTHDIAESKFESVKVITAQGQGEPRKYCDVTQRDERGVLRHGLIRGTVVSEGNLTIPCVCDRIELIDRSNTNNRGVLAKISVKGTMGVMNADTGEPVIQPAFSYLNTYFTLKGGLYFLVGDSNRMGAYHVGDEIVEVVPVTDGYTLEKVKSLIAEKEKE